MIEALEKHFDSAPHLKEIMTKQGYLTNWAIV